MSEQGRTFSWGQVRVEVMATKGLPKNIQLLDGVRDERLGVAPRSLKAVHIPTLRDAQKCCGVGMRAVGHGMSH